jgi:hypothetical protein
LHAVVAALLIGLAPTFARLIYHPKRSIALDEADTHVASDQ